jgi:hypothetical protein
MPSGTRGFIFAITTVTARDRGLTLAGQLTVGSTRLELEIPVEVEETTDGALRLEGETSSPARR